MPVPATSGRKKTFCKGKKAVKVAETDYFVIYAKSLMENMNNAKLKTVKKFGARCPGAQARKGECGPKDCDNRVIMVYVSFNLQFSGLIKYLLNTIKVCFCISHVLDQNN